MLEMGPKRPHLDDRGFPIKHKNYKDGGRGIRTPGAVPRTTVFKTAAFNHSAIPPLVRIASFHCCYVKVPSAGSPFCLPGVFPSRMQATFISPITLMVVRQRSRNQSTGNNSAI